MQVLQGEEVLIHFRSLERGGELFEACWHASTQTADACVAEQATLRKVQPQAEQTLRQTCGQRLQTHVADLPAAEEVQLQLLQLRAATQTSSNVLKGAIRETVASLEAQRQLSESRRQPLHDVGNRRVIHLLEVCQTQREPRPRNLPCGDSRQIDTHRMIDILANIVNNVLSQCLRPGRPSKVGIQRLIDTIQVANRDGGTTYNLCLHHSQDALLIQCP
mmetsp:Transcript_28897/g.67266  ORF Transcript_28897/g.67266 Transcript_28897/m.67266 type:complete len:219 (+) Transcript_28897:104-760(+)